MTGTGSGNFHMPSTTSWARGSLGHALLCAGRYAEALMATRAAVATDTSTSSLAYHALATMQLGEAGEAMTSARALLARAREAPIARMIAAEALARAGAGSEATALLATAETTPDWRAPTVAAAVAHVLGDDDGALRWLERALAQRDVWLPAARNEPRLRPCLRRRAPRP